MELNYVKNFLLITHFLLILFLIVPINGQQRNRLIERPGSCPPPTSITICNEACKSDFDCRDPGKCCPTSCGGQVCTRPVTPRKLGTVKPGSCPEVPTGRWICTSMCSSDSECNGRRKCCQNRCGAYMCQVPELFESDYRKK